MSEWITIKQKLPDHNEIVFVFGKSNLGNDSWGCAVFVDSIKMNETLWKTGFGNEAVDTKKHPYYFVSQEVKQHTYRNVSHWMPLSKPTEVSDE